MQAQQQSTLPGAILASTPQIMRVVGPLVRLLQQHAVSWHDRERIADAIGVAVRHYEDMEAEHRHLHGAGAARAGEPSQKD